MRTVRGWRLARELHMPRSILVADDDRSMLNLYDRIFSTTDYAVSMAESFAEASKLIDSNDYDLLVTDLMFPDGLGTGLIKAFHAKKSEAKSFLVTGSRGAAEIGEVPDVEECFEKPFNISRFMSAVTKALT
jgi:DNA-binding NtrC family response regulator